MLHDVYKYVIKKLGSHQEISRGLTRGESKESIAVKDQ